jgi:hypothetical protein
MYLSMINHLGQKISTIALFLTFLAPLNAQTFEINPDWIPADPQSTWDNPLFSEGNNHIEIPQDLKNSFPSLQWYRFKMPFSSNIIVKATLTNEVWREWSLVDSNSSQWISQNNLKQDGNPIIRVIQQNSNRFISDNLVFINPIKIIDNKIWILTSGKLEISQETQVEKRNKLVSSLASGSLYKISVGSQGMVKLDFDFFRNKLGISDISSIPINQIQVLGNGGIPLSEKPADPRIDDLESLPLHIKDGGDGRLNPGDYVIFYCPGHNHYSFSANGTFNITKNPYDIASYFFVKIGTESDNKIKSRIDFPGFTTRLIDNFQDYLHLEDDKVNLLASNKIQRTEGSGRLWFGDELRPGRKTTWTGLSAPGKLSTFPTTVSVGFATYCPNSSNFSLELGSVTRTLSMSGFPHPSPTETFGDYQVRTFTDIPTTDNLSISATYNSTGVGCTGWTDFIEATFYRSLRLYDDQQIFRNIASISSDTLGFIIKNFPSGGVIWDITDPTQPILQNYSMIGEDAKFSFLTEGKLREFVAFLPEKLLITPNFSGRISNQNLHNLSRADMVIITTPKLITQANRLAAHRKSLNKFEVAVIDVNQIMNEFSSGSLDISSIRDFNRMLLKRDSNYRFLLLLGDGTYDYRNIEKSIPQENIPVFQTIQSLDPVNAFPSDDYIGLLDDQDGGQNLGGALDLAIGRLPSSTENEARIMIDKIIKYETDTATLGDWRMNMSFIGDDGDGNTHMNDANNLSDGVNRINGIFRQEKIMLDAYNIQSTSGGQFYPDVNQAINNSILRGLLVMNYSGHGGPRGLAQERILTENDVLSWSNPNRLPLIITATCSFTGFDDAKETVGEKAIRRENGGCIALFTTTRAVYAYANYILNSRSTERLVSRKSGKYGLLGEELQDAKNGIIDANSRKFVLIGDPALQLAIPSNKVVIEKLNNKPISIVPRDTIGALESFELSGFISEPNGTVLNNFNGIASITILDKPQRVRTLGNEPGSRIFDFNSQNNLLFKGTTRVVNGKWTINGTFPKDINYNIGYGKIIAYARAYASMVDAGGANDSMLIGGTGAFVVDNSPPKIKIYLNTRNFNSGDKVGSNPFLIVDVSDDQGINITGNAVGHDFLCQLTGPERRTINLNDLYEAKDSRSGTGKFLIRGLKPGKYRLDGEVWDLSNNRSRDFVEFEVSDDGNEINEIRSYPNPSSGNLSFRIYHNLPPQNADLNIDLYSLDGKLVKNFEYKLNVSGDFLDTPVWDGNTDNGGSITSGMYVYRVKLNPFLGNSIESKFEKLVIIK